MGELSTGRAVVLYIGALLGPSVLVLPGIVAGTAGPASLLAWCVLLALSGLLAWMFSALGTRLAARGGAAGYVGVAFGPRAERAVAACFISGVVAGAPVVCLIGGTYAAAAIGAGPVSAAVAAVIMLIAVVLLTLGGARVSASVQLVLVGALVALVVVAVVGALPHAETRNWRPFAPHGWVAVGRAGSLLMLSFVGWEAIAPLTGRLRDRARQLPRVIGAAFAVTSTLYLGLAVATVAVLGNHASTRTPVADLMAVAIGPAAAVAAAVAALALTLAAVNAYLSGASEMLSALNVPRARTRLPVAVAVAAVGVLVLAAVAMGWLSTVQLIAVPTACFVAVYIACTASGARVLRGPVRVASGVGLVLVTVVAAFSGWVILLPAVVAAVAASTAGRFRASAAKSVVDDQVDDDIRC